MHSAGTTTTADLDSLEAWEGPSPMLGSWLLGGRGLQGLVGRIPSDLAVNLLICHWILFWPSRPFSLTDCFREELPFRGLCRWPAASRSPAAVQVSQCSFQRTLFWKAPGPKPEGGDFPTEKVIELVGYNDILWFKKKYIYILYIYFNNSLLFGGQFSFCFVYNPTYPTI